MAAQCTEGFKLAGLLTARHVGFPLGQGLMALSRFENVKQRMEVRGIVNGANLVGTTDLPSHRWATRHAWKTT